ncbi:MAG: hypothetical protein ACAI35_14490 [Candidatus Methylacidiphilales bacterium]|nr:hypothetical protein [Candidatus Methylacidiphilales bacterium]
MHFKRDDPGESISCEYFLPVGITPSAQISGKCAFSDPPRLLCIDSNVAFLKRLKVFLEIHGFEVVMASSGMDAIMQYKSHAGRFCAIISEKKSAFRDTMLFIGSVRKAGFKGKVIIVSEHFHPEDIIDYFDLDVACYVEKLTCFHMIPSLLLKDIKVISTPHLIVKGFGTGPSD